VENVGSAINSADYLGEVSNFQHRAVQQLALIFLFVFYFSLSLSLSSRRKINNNNNNKRVRNNQANITTAL
jgi:hypothetical protein